MKMRSKALRGIAFSMILSLGLAATGFDTTSNAIDLKGNDAYYYGQKGVQTVDIGRHLFRISGADRYETAVNISKSSSLSAQRVYIASGQAFTDSICASYLSFSERAYSFGE